MTEFIGVAAVQCSLKDDGKENTQKISHWVEQAAQAGAKIILPSELFHGHYFCKEEREEFFARALPVAGHPLIEHFSKLARSLQVVIPLSFFEREGQAYYNSVALLDRGELRGVYRKSHIPDGPGYEEKYYFNPGNTGFKVWETPFGCLGIGICWDQWFPECARILTLRGADLLLYPTAIGSEPGNPDLLATKDRWQAAMIGHSVCNVIPVAAANRCGQEGTQHFYGHSFVSDEKGRILSQLGPQEEGFVLERFDWKAIRSTRASWGFFRDRRTDLYRPLLTQDGTLIPPSEAGRGDG